MNLAAFFADVNPNYWNTDRWIDQFGQSVAGIRYAYEANWLAPIGSPGDSFADAQEFLAYRYANNPGSLARPPQLFASLVGVTFFPPDGIDFYCDGPAVAGGGSAATLAAPDVEAVNRPWSGSDSRQHFFTIHDFWDARKFPNPRNPQRGFLARLAGASARGNSEDR
jgi:hypothetical protein